MEVALHAPPSAVALAGEAADPALEGHLTGAHGARRRPGYKPNGTGVCGERHAQHASHSGEKDEALHAVIIAPPLRQNARMASYSLNDSAVEHARRLIEGRQYVLESDWGEVQPRADDENAFLESHSWEEYADWHLGLTDGATDETKARYAFVYGDFRRVHRMGLIACLYRAAEWRHKDVELAAHELLQLLDSTSA